MMSHGEKYMLREKELQALPGWPMQALFLMIVPTLTVLTMIETAEAISMRSEKV